jgi:hypothetical protein
MEQSLGKLHGAGLISEGVTDLNYLVEAALR